MSSVNEIFTGLSSEHVIPFTLQANALYANPSDAFLIHFCTSTSKFSLSQVSKLNEEKCARLRDLVIGLMKPFLP